jgi:uncharacterized membrane protein
MAAPTSTPTEQRVMGHRTLVLNVAVLAVSTALVFVVTRIAAVPISAVPGQEFDFGDIMIFIFAWTFGERVGGFAGGIGSAISDFTNGGIYAPFTLVIKGTEGFLAGYFARRNFRGGRAVSWVLASFAMVGGYFITNAYAIGFFFGTNSILNPGLLGGLYEVPFDTAQVVAGGIIGRYVSNYLKRSLPSSLLTGRAGVSKGPKKVESSKE